MTSATRGNFARQGGLLLGWLAVAFVAAFLGLVAAVMPWFIAVGLVIVPLVLVVAAAFPAAGSVFALAMIFEVLPSAFQPRLPFGGSILQLSDLLIIYLLGVSAIRLIAQPRPIWRDLGPLRIPFAYLGISVAIGLVYAKLGAGNTAWLSEGRSFIAWALLPILLLAVESPKATRMFRLAVVAIGFIVCIYVVVQSLFDVRIMTAARVESLDNRSNSDVIRSIAGGGVYLIIFCLFLTLNRWFEGKLPSWIAAPASVLLLLGLGVQFGRGVWVATAVGLLLSAAVHRGTKGVLQTIIIGGLSLAALMAALTVVKPRLAEALVERATGISAEVESGGSFAWRKIENQDALAMIERHPIMGVGIGGEYKQIKVVATFATETTYIHNGYLYFPLKLGLWASFIPLAFILGFFATLRRAKRAHQADLDRGFIAALGGTFAVPVITSITQPEWVNPQSVTALVCLMVLALQYLRSGSGVGTQHA